jgi:hypothetical protein
MRLGSDRPIRSDFPQNDHINDFEGPCFYRVFSKHSATTYASKSSVCAHLLQAQCEFSYSHLSLECIEEHLGLRDTHASPFISVFSDFGRPIPLLAFCAAMLIDNSRGAARSIPSLCPRPRGCSSGPDPGFRPASRSYEPSG